MKEKMPAGRDAVLNRSISEKIEELKAKKSLLDGDRKAYEETSQTLIQKNKERIRTLRKDNKELRQKLRDLHSKDEAVINKALKDKPVERASLKNKTGQEAITVLDHKVSDGVKQLNSLKHQVVLKTKQLEELKTKLDLQAKNASLARSTDKGESPEAQRIRYLENSCDKAQLKIHEAVHLRQTYDQILDKLKEDSLTWPLVLEGLEKGIKQCQSELEELRGMHNDAQLSKENALRDLKMQEDIIAEERKKRELALQEKRKEAEEKKMLHDRIERRYNSQRASFQQDEMSTTDKPTLSGEEQQQKITTYEEAFRRIKEATGVSDTMEVVYRFENQGATTAHLEELKKENEKQTVRLQEEKAALQKKFEEMKYTGESKLSSGQKMLEDFQEELRKENKNRDEIEEKLDKLSKILLQVKAGVDHLADKLIHLKTTKGHTTSARISPMSNEYVLDQLALCEEKLLKLMDEFGDSDLEKIQKQMEEEEFHANMENRLPLYNTRVKLPLQQQDETTYGADSESSREDDAEVLSRIAIKKQSKELIDRQTKKCNTRRRKKPK